MQYLQATTGDIPHLCQLLEKLSVAKADFVPTLKERARSLKTSIEDHSHSSILVARDGDKIVAMVSLTYTPSAGVWVALLEDMVVAPEARGQGIGSQLLVYALAFAKARRIKRISLLTNADNVAAQRFYKRHGFDSPTVIAQRNIISFSASL